jgi:hypothetical protein
MLPSLAGTFPQRNRSPGLDGSGARVFGMHGGLLRHLHLEEFREQRRNSCRPHPDVPPANHGSRRIPLVYRSCRRVLARSRPSRSKRIRRHALGGRCWDTPAKLSFKSTPTAPCQMWLEIPTEVFVELSLPLRSGERQLRSREPGALSSSIPSSAVLAVLRAPRRTSNPTSWRFVKIAVRSTAGSHSA